MKFDFGKELQCPIIFSLVIVKDKKIDYWLQWRNHWKRVGVRGLKPPPRTRKKMNVKVKMKKLANENEKNIWYILINILTIN